MTSKLYTLSLTVAKKKYTLSHLGQQLLAVVRPAGTGAAVPASLARRHLHEILRLRHGSTWQPRATRHKELRT